MIFQLILPWMLLMIVKLMQCDVGQSIFGVNIYAEEYPFKLDMVEDIIVDQDVYNFRVFNPDWVPNTSEFYNLLSDHKKNGKPISLFINIPWDKPCIDFAEQLNGYDFGVSVQIDSCIPETAGKDWWNWVCINPTEKGFCQTEALKDGNVEEYIQKLEKCSKVLDHHIEFVIPWQHYEMENIHCKRFNEVLQKALKIQTEQGRRFSVSGTIYKHWMGPCDGVFNGNRYDGCYSFCIDEIADRAQKQADEQAKGLQLGFMVAEIGWPEKCDSLPHKCELNRQNLCQYYGQARSYYPKGDNKNVRLYWWLIDDRRVDDCGAGAFGLYDEHGTFKCGNTQVTPQTLPPNSPYGQSTRKLSTKPPNGPPIESSSSSSKPWLIPVVVICVCIVVIVIIFVYRTWKKRSDISEDDEDEDEDEVPLNPKTKKFIRKTISKQYE